MNKNVTIDRLRGLSVLVVICMHYLFFYPNALAFVGPALGNGFYGVTAFFCVSGFLITTNILRRYERVARTDLYAFYVMRVGRIVPPLVLLCLALTLLSRTAIPQFHFVAPVTLKDCLFNLVMLRFNHYYQRAAAGMPVWAILWSLSVEEAFYLAYPLTAKVIRSTWALVLLLLAVIVYAPFHREPSIVQIYDYFGCFDAIALGALAALGARRFGGQLGKPAAWTVMSAGLALMVGAYAAINVRLHYNWGISLIALGAALILFASQCAPFASTRPRAYDPLAYLGRLSYEMYLIHMTIFALLQSVLLPRFGVYPRLLFAFVLLCVVAVSDVFARFYAEPLNRWLRALLLRPARHRTDAGAATAGLDSLSRHAGGMGETR